MNRNLAAIPALAVLAGAVLGGLSPAHGAQRDRDVIIAELRQIQSQVNELHNAQAALLQAIQKITGEQSAHQESLRTTLADSKLALESLQKDLSVLSARVDETNGRIGNLRQELASMRNTQQPLVLPPTEQTDGTGDVDEPAGEDPEAPVVAAGPSVTDIYNQARIDYTQGRYQLAISGFQDVLDAGRGSDLADNAHYWIGESYFAQRQYESAIDSFDTVIRDYPDSNKRSDAYIKKGVALQNMGQRSEAMLIFELVIQQFPRTPHERLAKARLEELMRTTPPR